MANRSSGPLYRQIVEWVNKRIESNDLRPGDALDSEFELCRRFGVSRITVRASLKELEQQGVIERFAGKGTFIKAPDRVAQSDAHPTVAFVVNTAIDPWIWPVIAGAEATLREFGYNLVIGDANHDEDEMERLVEKYRVQQGVRGILVVGVEDGGGAGVVQRLKATGTPFVMVDHYIPQIESDIVVSDDHGGAYAATEHLIKLGHRSILLLSQASDRTSSVGDRIAGFRRACLENGISLSHCYERLLPKLRVQQTGPNDEAIQLQVQQISELLKEHPEVTAVFGLDDIVAMHTVQAARQLGYRVPDDLSVVGFGDIFNSSLETPMTNLHIDRPSLGSNAARTLLTRIANPAFPTQRVVLPVRFMVRKSTGAPAGIRAQA